MKAILYAEFLDPRAVCPPTNVIGRPCPSRFASLIAAADEIVLVDLDRAGADVRVELLRLCAKEGKTPRREETGVGR